MKADYDVALHNSRVFADSGQVPDNITTDRNVRLLKQAGLWESCVFFGDTARGVKKDSNEFVSKVYDLKANADLLQDIGTAQPIYQPSNGSLYFDSGDSLVSTLSLLSKLGRDPNITIAQWIYWGGSEWISNYPASFRLNLGTVVAQSIAVTYLIGKVAYDVYGYRVLVNTPLNVKQWYFVVITKFAGLLTVANTKIYANNVELPATSSSTSTQPNLTGGIVTIGKLDDYSTQRRWLGSIGETMVFDRVISESERQFLFDITKSNYGVV